MQILISTDEHFWMTTDEKGQASKLWCGHSKRRWLEILETQFIGAYGTQWVPWSFEVRVCFRIIMSFI